MAHRRMHVRRSALDPCVFAWVCAVCLAWAGCDAPTWTVLQPKPKCEPGAAGASGDCKDPGKPAEDAGKPAMACIEDGECDKGELCVKGLCVACSGAEATCPATCPWQFKPELFKRNGCAVCECAPVNRCQSDAECGSSERCYRGQQCQDNCVELGCCFGNFCSAPGCEDQPAVSCSIVGCQFGICSGDFACEPASCKCDGKVFQCAPDCTGAKCAL